VALPSRDRRYSPEVQKELRVFGLHPIGTPAECGIIYAPTGRELKTPTMERTVKHRSFDLPTLQGSALVRTDIADGVDGARDVED
jgi:hypothetical protein